MANISNPPVLLKSGLLQPDVLSTYQVPVIKIDAMMFPFFLLFLKARTTDSLHDYKEIYR